MNKKTIYFQKFKIDCLQNILIITNFAWLLSSAFLYSVLARYLGIFFLLEILILIVWLFIECRKKDTDIWKETRTVDLAKYKKPINIAWIVVIVIAIGVDIFNALTTKSFDFTTPYNMFCLISKFFAPFLFAAVPLYLQTIIYSAKKMEVQNEE